GRVTTDGNVTLIPLAGEFNAGTGMTSGPDGNLWYSGSPNPWVVRVTPQGSVTRFSTPSGALPRSLMVGPDLNLWFAESGSSPMIAKLTTSGTFTEYP